jgi:alkylation response protein AidB-like acyl-CoA dehydrogenase
VNTSAITSAPTAAEIALLRESVRESLQTLYPGLPGQHWQQSWATHWDTLTAQGLWSTIEPPDGSLATAAVVVEELGRVLYPGPACEVLTATYVLSRLAEAAATPGVAPGGATALFATGDVAIDSSRVLTATLDPMIPGSAEARLVIATDDGDLVVVSAGTAEAVDAPSLDVSRRVAELTVHDEPATIVSAPPELVTEARAAKALLYCADTLGCVEQVLERTAQYAAQRTTFGSPIGKYQAVAHRLVDHAVSVQQMRLLLDGATTAFDHRAPDLVGRVATTETYFSRRSSEIISDCIQLAGAIGFTWEFGHHFYLRRIVQNTSLGSGHGRPQQRLAREAKW